MQNLALTHLHLFAYGDRNFNLIHQEPLSISGLKFTLEEMKYFIFGGDDAIDADMMYRMSDESIRGVKNDTSLYIFDGTVWKSVKSSCSYIEEVFDKMIEQYQLFETYISDLIRQNVDIKDNEKILKAIQRKIKKLSTGSYRRSVLALIKCNNIDVDLLDCQPYLINFNNGTMDVKTGVFREHRKEDYLTKKIDRNYDPNAECPHFMEFLNTVFCGNQDIVNYFIDQMGHYIIGFNPDALTIAVGRGNNGKSFLFKIILELLGTYGKMITSKSIFGSLRQSEKCLAGLAGVRFAVIDEMTDNQILSVDIKSIISRNRKSARVSYSLTKSFNAQYSMVSFTNNFPSIIDESNGMLKRLLFIPFNHTFPNSSRDQEDIHLKRYMDEGDGIIALMVSSAVRFIKSGFKISDVPDVIVRFSKDPMIELCLENEDEF